MTFGNLLQKARQSSGLMLSDVSKMTGIAATNLHRMEAGKRPPPKLEKLHEVMRSIQMDARSSRLLLWLVDHDMPESLAALALQERTIPLEDFESAALMRFLRVDPEKIAKATWLRIVGKIKQAREDAEREAALSVARDWPEVKKGE